MQFHMTFLVYMQFHLFWNNIHVYLHLSIIQMILMYTLQVLVTTLPNYSLTNYKFAKLFLNSVYQTVQCLLLIILANSLDPDQAHQGPNCFDTDCIPERIFIKSCFEKISRQQASMKNFPARNELTLKILT